jgi:hypothetical protein
MQFTGQLYKSIEYNNLTKALSKSVKKPDTSQQINAPARTQKQGRYLRVLTIPLVSLCTQKMHVT